jgi:hypothetical protein
MYQHRPLTNGSRRWVWEVTPSGRLAREAAAMQANSSANRPRFRRAAAKKAATKRQISKIILAVALFLLTLACASLMNEIMHDLWQATEVNRQQFLTQLKELCCQTFPPMVLNRP